MRIALLPLTPSLGPADGFGFLRGYQQAQARLFSSTLILLTRSYFNPVRFDLTHKPP
jgi:hypothetical protein